MNLQKYYIPQFSLTDNKEEGEKRRKKKEKKFTLTALHEKEAGIFLPPNKT